MSDAGVSVELSIASINGAYMNVLINLKDINDNLISNSKETLPVGVLDCMEAGLVAMKIDESRLTNQIINLKNMWDKLDSYNL